MRFNFSLKVLFSIAFCIVLYLFWPSSVKADLYVEFFSGEPTISVGETFQVWGRIWTDSYSGEGDAIVSHGFNYSSDHLELVSYTDTRQCPAKDPNDPDKYYDCYLFNAFLKGEDVDLSYTASYFAYATSKFHPEPAVLTTGYVNFRPVSKIVPQRTEYGFAERGGFETVTFSGSSSYDPDGSIENYLFDCGEAAEAGGGPDDILCRAKTGNYYRVTLAVTDDEGFSHIATATAMPKPAVTFSCTKLEETEAKYKYWFDGAAQDKESVSSWYWDFGDGTSSTGEDVTHSFLSGSAQEVTLTATYNDGYSSSASGNIAECQDLLSGPPDNQAPIAGATISKNGTDYADSITVVQGEATKIFLSAEGSDDPNGWTDATNGVSTGGKCEWNYDLDATPNFEIAVNNPASVDECDNFAGNGNKKTFNDAPGTYTYSVLRITDKPGLQSNVDTVQVTVAPPPNQPPIASIECDPASCQQKVGKPLTFLNKSSDPDGSDDIIDSQWDVKDWDSTPDLTCIRPSALCNYTPSIPAGDYTIELFVEDEEFQDTESKNFKIIPGVCGDNEIDPGEQCDPPGGACLFGPCQADCTCPPLIPKFWREILPKF